MVPEISQLRRLAMTPRSAVPFGQLAAGVLAGGGGGGGRRRRVAGIAAIAEAALARRSDVVWATGGEREGGGGEQEKIAKLGHGSPLVSDEIGRSALAAESLRSNRELGLFGGCYVTQSYSDICHLCCLRM